jgi:hypothetical protein
MLIIRKLPLPTHKLIPNEKQCPPYTVSNKQGVESAASSVGPSFLAPQEPPTPTMDPTGLPTPGEASISPHNPSLHTFDIAANTVDTSGASAGMPDAQESIQGVPIAAPEDCVINTTVGI